MQGLLLQKTQFINGRPGENIVVLQIKFIEEVKLYML